MASTLAEVDGTLKKDETNPKDLLGIRKAALRLVPPALAIYTSLPMMVGGTKYDPYNWRGKKVRQSVYLEAMLRHIYAVMDGEDVDEETGGPHEASIAACVAIVLDARATGNLIDDRPPRGAAAEALKEVAAIMAAKNYYADLAEARAAREKATP